jgi:ADP-sugar diphosphatase
MSALLTSSNISICNFTFNNGINSTIRDAVIRDASNSNSKVAKWLDTCEQNHINIKNINVEAVTMFGPNIGFIYIIADAYNSNGNKLPGTVFIRGGAVCCLLIIRNSDTNEHFMVVVEEIKVPVGASIIQTPAGMRDNSNNIKGKIIDEIKEETGITISNQMVHYNDIDKVHANTLIHFDGFYPSQGGCDEYIDVFAYLTEMTSEQLAEVNGRLLGNADEDEMIKVHVQPLKWSTIDESKDSKLMIAASKFDRKFPGIIMP